jgi:hypothetical protein
MNLAIGNVDLTILITYLAAVVLFGFCCHDGTKNCPPWLVATAEEVRIERLFAATNPQTKQNDGCQISNQDR